MACTVFWSNLLLPSTTLSISVFGYDNFCDLFDALFIPSVLNIYNLGFRMHLIDLTHQRLN